MELSSAKASEVLKQFDQSATVASLYDRRANLRAAIVALLPGFEYPDISHLTIAQLRAKVSAHRVRVAAKRVCDRIADRIDGYDRDDLGESADY